MGTALLCASGARCLTRSRDILSNVATRRLKNLRDRREERNANGMIMTMITIRLLERSCLTLECRYVVTLWGRGRGREGTSGMRAAQPKLIKLSFGPRLARGILAFRETIRARECRDPKYINVCRSVQGARLHGQYFVGELTLCDERELAAFLIAFLLQLSYPIPPAGPTARHSVLFRKRPTLMNEGHAIEIKEP